MKSMRPAVFFFVTLLFFAPSALFSLEKFDPKATLGSNDKCLNEKMVIFNGRPIIQKGSTETEQYKTCKNISGGCSLEKEKTKPNTECNCGKLFYTPEGKKPIPLDKCDPNMQKNLVKAMAAGRWAKTTFTNIAELRKLRGGGKCEGK